MAVKGCTVVLSQMAAVSEERHRIKMYPYEAEEGNAGISPTKVVKEGTYRLDVGMKRKADTTQQQKLRVTFNVEYRTE